MDTETLHKFMEKINSSAKFRGLLKYGEPMSLHTTFKTGGKADVFVRPEKDRFTSYAAALFKTAKKEGIPVFILGGGANILVSDRGIRGIVLDTCLWTGFEEDPAHRRNSSQGEPQFADDKAGFAIKVLSGTPVDSLVYDLADHGLSGLEFLAGLPGSVGGAVWMNARCYEKSISDALLETLILDENHEEKIIPFRPEDFSYKQSPFQKTGSLILSARFTVRNREKTAIRDECASYRRDREEKGHYRFPSAGSAFKNNRVFGEPSGKIIDKAGLRGFAMGGAQVAPWHGNIIINTGTASSCDIKALMDEVARLVKEERGFELESEILFAGEW